jgi:hypothetical protein
MDFETTPLVAYLHIKICYYFWPPSDFAGQYLQAPTKMLFKFAIKVDRGCHLTYILYYLKNLRAFHFFFFKIVFFLEAKYTAEILQIAVIDAYINNYLGSYKHILKASARRQHIPNQINIKFGFPC